MKDILDEIVQNKRMEIARVKKELERYLDAQAYGCTREPLSMHDALATSASGIIAEFKRKSPSKGWIKEDGDAENITLSYANNGAAALSILTDEKYFGGSLNFLRTARSLVQRPILRKDFIIDPIQMFEARLAGADAVLLIAACLFREDCRKLAHLAHELRLEVFLEIHDETELDYISDEVDIIGVNNRNLGTFHTDVENSFRLVEQLPKEKLLVSESGISDAKTILKLREAGYRGFLIGEQFMKMENPGMALSGLIREIEAR